jgi:hypothetical protein
LTTPNSAGKISKIEVGQWLLPHPSGTAFQMDQVAAVPAPHESLVDQTNGPGSSVALAGKVILTGGIGMYVSWNNHIVSLAASVVREVNCEKCGTQYFYAVRRRASGTGTSVYGLDEAGARGRATDRAVTALQNSLQNAFDVVPCPNCGIYQARMVEFMKNAHLKWLLPVGGLLIAGACLALVPVVSRGNIVSAVAAAVLLLAGLGLIFFRYWSVDHYDPNQGDPEPRKQLGRNLALLKQDAPPGSL